LLWWGVRLLGRSIGILWRSVAGRGMHARRTTGLFVKRDITLGAGGAIKAHPSGMIALRKLGLGIAPVVIQLAARWGAGGVGRFGALVGNGLSGGSAGDRENGNEKSERGTHS